MRESLQPGRLVSFTLTEVPLDIRLRAAQYARPSTRGALERDHPEDRLFATLLGGDHDDLVDVAREPSTRVYWITEQAWRAVMG